MVLTVRDRLLDALDDLTEDELRRFKAKLHEFPVQAEGYRNIPRGRLERVDALDLSDLLIQYYTEAKAPQVAAGVLQAIACQRQAEQLLGSSGNVACSEAPQPNIGISAGTYGTQAATSPELHFIDRHRDALIQRTVTVEGILDMLHGDILDEEQYETISAKKTNQEKMRELYKLMPSWNRYCKDKLYEAIKIKNKYLVADLEGQPEATKARHHSRGHGIDQFHL